MHRLQTTQRENAKPRNAAAPAGARLHVQAPPALDGPRCACGGGCPRCASPLPVSQPGDPLERAADARVQQAVHAPGTLHAAAHAARLHTGPQAARLARSLHARAFTIGSDVVFGEDQFHPETPGGRRLIAHELAHVEQQRAGAAPAVQRQADVIDMEPLTVRSTLEPVDTAFADLSSLRGVGVQPGAMTVARDDATIRRNSPAPTQRLPFGSGGWDAQAILTALGQYDTLPGTDSDALRCVQAVAMAARVPDGPAAVAGFLRGMILEGMLGRPQNPRERTAIDVLEHVIGRIETERATFGDMLWAQEALHDLFYSDVAGTPEPDIRDRMRPAMDILGRSLEPLNVWCNGPADVISAANALQPGEQLLVNTWQVVFNTAFDQLEDQGIEVAEGRSTTVEVNGRLRRIRRLRTDARPPHTAIDDVRDTRQGHQLLVMRDSTTRQLRLYEPEITNSGRHLEDLAADGSNFQRYFRDLPDVGIYNYIQILGRLTPSSLATSGFGTTP